MRQARRREQLDICEAGQGSLGRRLEVVTDGMTRCGSSEESRWHLRGYGGLGIVERAFGLQGKLAKFEDPQLRRARATSADLIEGGDTADGKAPESASPWFAAGQGGGLWNASYVLVRSYDDTFLRQRQLL
jgi:hypothetical protein